MGLVKKLCPSFIARIVSESISFAGGLIVDFNFEEYMVEEATGEAVGTGSTGTETGVGGTGAGAGEALQGQIPLSGSGLPQCTQKAVSFFETGGAGALQLQVSPSVKVFPQYIQNLVFFTGIDPEGDEVGIGAEGFFGSAEGFGALQAQGLPSFNAFPQYIQKDFFFSGAGGGVTSGAGDLQVQISPSTKVLPQYMQNLNFFGVLMTIYLQ